MKNFIVIILVFGIVGSGNSGVKDWFLPNYSLQCKKHGVSCDMKSYMNRTMAGRFPSKGWTPNDWLWILQYVYMEFENIIPKILLPSINPNPFYFMDYPNPENLKRFTWDKWNNWRRIIVDTDTIIFNNDGQIVETAYFTGFYKVSQTNSYAGNGNLTENSIIYRIGSDIVDGIKMTYSYDANNRVCEMAEMNYDVNEKKWKYDFKGTFTYNNNSMPVEMWEYLWDDNIGQWKDVGQKYFFTYDNSNNCMGRRMEAWDNTSGTWVESNQKTAYAYNNRNLMTEEIHWAKKDDTGEWRTEEKIGCAYNAAGNYSDISLHQFDTLTNDWVPARGISRHIFAYNNKDFLCDQISAVKKPDVSQWVNYRRSEFFYDSSDNLYEEMDYQWDTLSSTWKKARKLTFTYNSKKDPASASQYYLDTLTQEWVLNLKLPIQIIYSTNINNPSLVSGKSDVTVRIETKGMKLQFSLDGTVNKNQKLRIFDVKGRLITALKPEMGKEKTLYTWHYGISHKKLGNNLYIYSLRNRDSSLAGKVLIR